ncbi:hypothetical protein HYX18_02895 [Candidatus Woesearchaeota archaeon]|nr:hypothetical protein [Candidatus Woesearchaeota archaeon]
MANSKNSVKKTHKAEKHHHEEKSVMYFKVDYPLELRKEVLKTAIEATQLLKRYEAFKGLLHLRHETYSDFNKIYKDIEFLSKKLRNRDLPVISKVQEDIKKVKIAEQRKMQMRQQQIVQKIEMGKSPSVEEHKHHLSEVERLDEELREIQQRLRNLDV